MRKSRNLVWVSALLVIAMTLGHGEVLYAFDPAGDESLGLAGLAAQTLDDEVLDEVTGQSFAEFMLGVIVGYVTSVALDYYGVRDWLEETAFPAVDSAVLTAAEWVKESVEEGRITDLPPPPDDMPYNPWLMLDAP